MSDYTVLNSSPGLTAKLADKILAVGADVITLGNHVWRQRDIIPVLARKGRVIRPENLGGPGCGLTVQPAEDGTPVAVINLQGALFLSPAMSAHARSSGSPQRARPRSRTWSVRRAPPAARIRSLARPHVRTLRACVPMGHGPAGRV